MLETRDIIAHPVRGEARDGAASSSAAAAAAAASFGPPPGRRLLGRRLLPPPPPPPLGRRCLQPPPPRRRLFGRRLLGRRRCRCCLGRRLRRRRLRRPPPPPPPRHLAAGASTGAGSASAAATSAATASAAFAATRASTDRAPPPPPPPPPPPRLALAAHITRATAPTSAPMASPTDPSRLFCRDRDADARRDHAGGGVATASGSASAAASAAPSGSVVAALGTLVTTRRRPHAAPAVPASGAGLRLLRLVVVILGARAARPLLRGESLLCHLKRAHAAAVLNALVDGRTRERRGRRSPRAVSRSSSASTCPSSPRVCRARAPLSLVAERLEHPPNRNINIIFSRSDLQGAWRRRAQRVARCAPSERGGELRAAPRPPCRRSA